MKYILLYAIAFASAIDLASAQWTPLNSVTTNNLYAVSFYNARLGYAVGAKGTVLRTKDGGDSWSLVSAPDSTDLTSVVIIDNSTLLVTTSNSSGNSSVYKSLNSGGSWHKVLHDDLPFYATMTPDGRIFCISTYVYESTDSGETWKPQKQLSTTSIYTHIEFPDNAVGYVAGNIRGQYTYTPEFLRSTDGGNKWHPSYSFGYPDTTGFSTMSAMNADTIFMFTSYYKHFQPKNKSELLMITRFHLKGTVSDSVWNFHAKIQVQGMQDIVHACKFFEGGEGFAAGNVGVIYHTSTYGKRWNKEYTGRTSINGIFMQNLNKGYAVGDGGLILRREDTTTLTVSAAVPVTMTVYPNPAVANSTVAFTLHHSASVILQVANEKGMVVYSNQLKQYEPGSYQFHLPVGDFQGGLYHVVLVVNGTPVARKELLVLH